MLKKYRVRFTKKKKDGTVDFRMVKVRAATSNLARGIARRRFGKIRIISAMLAP